MPMDVTAQRIIPLRPEQVAAYAMDWRHDHEWTQGIRTAELTRSGDDAEFGLGAEVTRTAYFLGRRIDYVLKVVGYEPPTLLDLRSVAGPFPMHVTYRFDEHPEGTLASIRIRSDADGFYRFAGPLMSLPVRDRIRKDLRDLHRVLTR
ncbi:MAG TPA: SRPBCC family protein [Candidatus Binatia bacterium]|nr:SRPBCC family protein [Candidatus Binatia bacterium]